MVFNSSHFALLETEGTAVELFIATSNYVRGENLHRQYGINLQFIFAVSKYRLVRANRERKRYYELIELLPVIRTAA